MKNAIKIRQLPTSKFEKNKFRTNKVTEGVNAIVGITKKGISTIQSFSFDADAFNLTEAKNWIKENRSKLKENYGFVTVASGTSDLPATMNNDVETTFPDNIMDMFPDVKFSNGKVNKEKVAIRLNDLRSYQSFLSTSNYKKANRLLLDLLKESYVETLTENGFNLLESENAYTADDFAFEMISICEAVHGSTLRKAKVRLIKSGESKNGNHYSGSCLKEATPLFDGLPIYPNHSDKVRGVEEKVGYYSDPIYVGNDEDGEIHAIANILESEQKIWELIKEQHLNPKAKLCGFSINAFGKGRIVQESGSNKKKRIVETIVHVDSTDIVDNPSAGGAVLGLLESVKLLMINKEGNESMDETTLRTKHPELVKLIEDSAKALVLKEADEKPKVKCECGKEFSGEGKTCPECSEKMKESVKALETEKTSLLAKLDETEKKIKELERDNLIKNLTESVRVKMSDKKFTVLPQALKDRLVESLVSMGTEQREGEKPSNWDLKITEELNYVNLCRDEKSKLVLASDVTNDKKTETVKLSESEQRAIAATVSKTL